VRLVVFRRIHPEPGEIDVGELLAGAGLAERATAERPYTLANFIASADGRATFHGRSGKLGDLGDRHLFHTLREHADAVLVGTRTLENERYGRIVPDEARRARRVAAGMQPEPLACVITRTGVVAQEIPLMKEPDARVVVYCCAEVDLSEVAAQVEVVRIDCGSLTGATVLRHLRAEHGIRLLLCEGGPTLFASLVHERALDELFLTIAPKLAGGGTGPAITTGPELPEPARLQLEWVLEREGSLFLRYGLRLGQ
jgi:5-amino-6-(5-phosphoribosylamino)uracil reductase